MNPCACVRTELELRMVVPVGPALPVLAELRYEARDPWAVRVTFSTGDSTGDNTGDSTGGGEGAVEWLFARQLLADGLREPAGEGDVRVHPSSGAGAPVVTLVMASPSGSARFEADLGGVLDFLQRTYQVVPAGAEAAVVDLDGELAVLLDRA